MSRIPKDKRLYYIEIPCGKCQECKRKRASEWRARLSVELKENPDAQFITLTFNDETLEKYKDTEANETAAIFARRLTKNCNKQKIKIKRYLVPEIGGEDSERLHFHGIVWPSLTEKQWEKIWPYGIVDIGYECSEKTIGYIVKYIFKPNEKFPDYEPRIFTSPGIGISYINSYDSRHNIFKRETDTKLKTEKGMKIELPRYWKQKMYTEEEREEIYLRNLEKNEKWVDGIKFSPISDIEVYNAYIKALERQKEIAKEAGFKAPKKS